MSETNHLFSQVDPEDERRRALAKVYAILLKLAEASEKEAVHSEANHNQDGTEEPASVKELIPA